MSITRYQGITNRSKANPKTQESEAQRPAFLQNQMLDQYDFLLTSQGDPRPSQATAEFERYRGTPDSREPSAQQLYGFTA